MADTLISLSGVGLTLPSQAGDVEILRGIDLAVAARESLGIVGPSGSGKSSLLMVLGGLERATSGSVSVLGEELTALDEDALARLRRDRMGVVFQSFHLIPTMTAIENVATPLELAGAPDAFDRASTLMAQVGLGHREGHYPAQLSGGEQQRVALARALAPRPRLLLADEPTGNLDGKTGEAVIDLLFGLTGEHAATLVLVTHETRLAERCARVVSMESGRIAGERAGTDAAGAGSGAGGTADKTVAAA
ncbi:MAG: ATP-binding cassette domain-containing protein [Pseudomonadota bacterium]